MKTYESINKNIYSSGKKTIGLYFFIETSLLNGRGYERTTLSLARNMNTEKFDVTILHTNLIYSRRLEDRELASLPDQVKIIEINRAEKFILKLGRIIRKLPLGKILELTVCNPIIYRMPSYKLPENILKNIGKGDIVYLADPADHTFFRNTGATIIGSNQGLFENPDALYTRIIIKLIEMGLLFKKIRYFHFFPMNKHLMEKLSNKESIVIPLGVDADKFPEPNNEKDDVIRFFYIGALEEWKGLKLALDAFHLANIDHPVEFHIAGAGSMKDYVIKISGMDKRIIFHNVVTEESKVQLFNKCDIFLYPSKGETFGIVISEALVSGEYVIAGERLKGNFDEEHELGYVSFCNYRVADIASLMENISRNISHIRSKRRNIREYAANKYDWKSTAKNLANFFLYTSKNSE